MDHYRHCHNALIASDQVRLTVAGLQKAWLDLSKEDRTEFGQMEMKLCKIYRLDVEPTDFITLRIQALSTEIKYKTKLRRMLTTAVENREISCEDYDGAIRCVTGYLQRIEVCIIKRRENAFARDLDNILHLHGDIRSAYAFLIIKEMHMTVSKQNSLRDSDRHTFQTNVAKWYDARRPIFASGVYEGYCHVTGAWLRMDKIRAVHIVSKSLQGDEIDYLFGHGTIDLSDPSNGLTLVDWIETALEENKIVIVPEESETELSWKVLVTDETLLELTGSEGDQWRNIDGKLLKFLDKNRPAIPFLYFRYLIAYLKCWKEGRTKWLKNFDIYKWGRIWASPGPYVRRSILESLIEEISNYSHLLPIAFTSNIAFVGAPRRLPCQEKLLSMSLAVLLINEASWIREKRKCYEENDKDTSSESELDEVSQSGDEWE